MLVLTEKGRAEQSRLSSQPDIYENGDASQMLMLLTSIEMEGAIPERQGFARVIGKAISSKFVEGAEKEEQMSTLGEKMGLTVGQIIGTKEDQKAPGINWRQIVGA